MSIPKSEPLKPCPFCRGKARMSFRQVGLIGQNEITGLKKIRWFAQVICNRCKSRGKPVAVETTVNLWSYPYIRQLVNETDPTPHIKEAADAWNERLV